MLTSPLYYLSSSLMHVGRVKQSNYFVLPTTYTIPGSKTINGEARVVSKGIVFNSSSGIYQDHPDRVLDKTFAHNFLKAINGHGVKDRRGQWLDSQSTVNMHYSCQLVEVGRHGLLVCTCKACAQYWECAHILAYRHVCGEVNVIDMMLTLKAAAPKGRPAADMEPIYSERQANEPYRFKNPAQAIGGTIRHQLSDGRFYNGKVYSWRLMPTKTAGEGIPVWDIRFPANQYEGDNDSAEEEEVREAQLIAGRKRYINWREGEMKDSNNSFCNLLEE